MKTRMIKLISIVVALTLGLASEVAKADFTFGEPMNLGPAVNSSAGDTLPPTGLAATVSTTYM